MHRCSRMALLSAEDREHVLAKSSTSIRHQRFRTLHLRSSKVWSGTERGQSSSVKCQGVWPRLWTMRSQGRCGSGMTHSRCGLKGNSVGQMESRLELGDGKGLHEEVQLVTPLTAVCNEQNLDCRSVSSDPNNMENDLDKQLPRLCIGTKCVFSGGTESRPRDCNQSSRHWKQVPSPC